MLRIYPPVLLVIFLAIGMLSLPSRTWSEEAPSKEFQTLPPVIVVGTLDPQSSWNPVLERKVVEQLPSGNGSLNELLRLLPGLQLSEEYNSAKTGGEILPPKISISGGKVYQNNFLIDGIANNNLIDPAKGSMDYVGDATGHPQERFLHSDLIEEIILYDSNVPARLGNFAGGVVEATTRDPGSEVEGQISFRTTRNEWTKFHLNPKDQTDFSAGGQDSLQPQFTKNDYGATFSFPVTDKRGVLVSWHMLDSRIPIPNFLGTKTQTRNQKSYFIKYAEELSSMDYFKLTFSSTPYREERFFKNVKDSDYVVKIDGLAMQSEWKHSFAASELLLTSAYRLSKNIRNGPPHFRNWNVSPSKDWGLLIGPTSKTSVEGGFGTIEKLQESFDLKGLLRFEPIRTGVLSHELTGGIDLTRTVGSFERKEDTYSYTKAANSVVVQCAGNDFDCIESEQYFTNRTLYSVGKSRAIIDQVALHGEDLLRYRRLEFRSGLRLDYNDLMEEANLAPRFFASYDLFGNSVTVFSAGANRYYGNTLLTDKLREAKIPTRLETRGLSSNNQPEEWTTTNTHGPNATRFTSLKTPYADELSLGLEQKLAGGILTLKYLQREGRDEFARSYSALQADGLRYYTLNNLGRSHHERYSLAWQRRWVHHFLDVNFSWQETTTTNEGYDTLLDSEDIANQVWFNNKLIDQQDLPALVQNRPVIVNLIWIAELPARFTFTNLSRYRSAYREIAKIGNLEEIALYEEINHRGKVIFDWKLGWSRRVYHQQLLAFTLEINNVFNSRIQTGGTTTTYEMGRQFWAGVAYDF